SSRGPPNPASSAAGAALATASRHLLRNCYRSAPWVALVCGGASPKIRGPISAMLLNTAAPATRQTRLSVMRAVQVVLGREQTIDGLCRALRRELSHVLDTTLFVVGVYDDVSQMVEVVHQNEGGAELPGGSFPLGNGFMSEV